MSFSASILSQRYMRADRFTRALDAFFPAKKVSESESQKPRSIERDLVELSPYNQIRQTLTEFRQQSMEAELNVSIQASSSQIESSASEEIPEDIELDKDLDLMLRMISKNDDEYLELKGRFKSLLKQAQKAYQTENPPAPTSSEGPSTVSELADQIVQQNSYKLDLKFRKTQTETKKTELSLEDLGIIKVDPLVLDMNGDGIDLTKAGEGAIFDIDADGKLDSTAWVKGDDAMLVYDENGNGKIDNGKELFGDQNGAQNGFAELAKHDKNSDGKISFLDPVYKALKLYQDLNGNGKIEKNELKTLDQMGIKSLNLDFVKNSKDLNGNSLVLSGSFERNNGTSGHLADVLLGFKRIP